MHKAYKQSSEAKVEIKRRQNEANETSKMV